MVQTGPKWEKDRYINFLGDPIGSDGKPASGISSLITPSFLNPAGSAVTLAGLCKLAFQQGADLGLLAHAGFGVVLGYMHQYAHSDSLRDIFKDAFDNKCIDLKPDKNTIPSIHKYGASVEDVKDLYGKGVAIHLLFLGIGLLASRHPVGLVFSQYMVSGLIEEIRIRSIFVKVAEGEAVIVDMPEPLRVMEISRADDGKQDLVPIPLRH
jgi:hypothetical protein